MKPGDRLRFRGPAGAPFVVTVGVGFDERTIKARVDSGEWTPLEESEAPEEKPKALPKRRAPRKAAAKKPPASE